MNAEGGQRSRRCLSVAGLLAGSIQITPITLLHTSRAPRGATRGHGQPLQQRRPPGAGSNPGRFPRIAPRRRAAAHFARKTRRPWIAEAAGAAEVGVSNTSGKRHFRSEVAVQPDRRIAGWLADQTARRPTRWARHPPARPIRQRAARRVDRLREQKRWPGRPHNRTGDRNQPRWRATPEVISSRCSSSATVCGGAWL